MRGGSSFTRYKAFSLYTEFFTHTKLFSHYTKFFHVIQSIFLNRGDRHILHSTSMCIAFSGSRKSFAILVSLYLFICMGLVCLYCLFLCVLMDSVPSGMSEDSCCDSDEGNCMARGWMVRVCVLISWSCFVYTHGCVSWRRSHGTLCSCGAMVLPWLAGVIIWDSVISQTWQKV